MNRYAIENLFGIEGLNIAWYGLIIACGIIGRWGNFVNPLNLALLTAMLICYPHFRRKGYLLPFYMIGYGTIRLFVEGLRSDSLYLLPGIRVSQVLSGCLIILGIVILFIIRKRQEVRQ